MVSYRQFCVVITADTSDTVPNKPQRERSKHKHITHNKHTQNYLLSSTNFSHLCSSLSINKRSRSLFNALNSTGSATSTAGLRASFAPALAALVVAVRSGLLNTGMGALMIDVCVCMCVCVCGRMGNDDDADEDVERADDDDLIDLLVMCVLCANELLWLLLNLDVNTRAATDNKDTTVADLEAITVLLLMVDALCVDDCFGVLFNTPFGC